MQYEQPEYIEENFNVSETSDLREFIKYIAIIYAILICLFALSDVFVGISAKYCPPAIEETLGKISDKSFKYDSQDKRLPQLNTLLDELIYNENLPLKDYQIKILENDEVNAVAIPGGTIGITKGLLKEIDNEDELAFVIGHELGHFANKDHLKALGRGLSAIVLSSVFLGSDSELSQFFISSMDIAQAKYSQSQEKAADLYGLNLLYRHYGNSNGSIKFMDKIIKKTKENEFIYFFATHPHPAKRLKYIKNEIFTQNMYNNENSLTDIKNLTE